jgi:hypothetical protein
MRVITGLLAAIAFASAAHADFVVVSPLQSDATPPPAVVAMPLEAPASPDGPKVAEISHAGPRIRPAYGFGDQIPLSFAVKQIVPPAVKVQYGPGASAAALVSWKGGDAWNRVLLAAVKPIGLRLVITDRAVEIRK